MSVFVNLRFFFLSISNFIVRLFNLAIWDPKRYHFPTYGLTQIIRYSSRCNSYRKHTVAISNSDYSMFMIMVFFVSMWNLYYMNILYIYMSCHVHPCSEFPQFWHIHHISFSQIIFHLASQSLLLTHPLLSTPILPNALSYICIVNISKRYLFTYNYALFTDFHWGVPMRLLVIFIIVHRNPISCENARLTTTRFFSFEKILQDDYGHDF